MMKFSKVRVSAIGLTAVLSGAIFALNGCGAVTAGDAPPTAGAEARPTPAPETPKEPWTPHAEVYWKTVSEEDTYGFLVERADGPEGPFVRVTDKIIEGHGTTNVPHEYSFVDKDVERGETYYYRLWSISYQGEKEMLGTFPFTVVPPEERDAPGNDASHDEKNP